MRPVALAGALLALLTPALSGCAPIAPAHPPAAPKGLRVVVLQYRSDIAPRRVQLEVVNDSKRAVVVRGAALADAGWAPAPAWSGSAAEIGAGATVDLPATLTRAGCSGRRSPSVRLDLAGLGKVAVPTTDSHGTLAGLHVDDCFAEVAARTAAFRFTGLVRLPHGRATLDVAVDAGPRIARGLTVTKVLATTLLAPSDGGDTWRVQQRIGAGGPTAFTLMAVPNRCDLHAIAEDKIGTVLPLQLRLADGSSGTVNVVAPPSVKQDVIAWVSDTCGVGRSPSGSPVTGPGTDIAPPKG